jgi:hypothetical protein
MKKVLKWLAVLIVLLFAFLIWFDWRFSMDVIPGQEINSADLDKKILIASQGSEYKNTIVEGLIGKLGSEAVHIKVIDVTGIDEITVDDWDAIVVMHTWEIWQPQEDAKKFLNAHYNPAKIFVLATSGDGGNMIEGVNGISGASIMDDVDVHIESLYQSIHQVIN